MNKVIRYIGVVFVVISTGLGAGCKKAVTDPTVTEGVANLPGATNVMAAIAKKDYDAAMAALLQIRQGVTTPEQDTHFKVLARTARDKMTEANDPKAAEAIATLRAMTTGGR